MSPAGVPGQATKEEKIVWHHHDVTHSKYTDHAPTCLGTEPLHRKPFAGTAGGSCCLWHSPATSQTFRGFQCPNGKIWRGLKIIVRNQKEKCKAGQSVGWDFFVLITVFQRRSMWGRRKIKKITPTTYLRAAGGSLWNVLPDSTPLSTAATRPQQAGGSFAQLPDTTRREWQRTKLAVQYSKHTVTNPLNRA